MKKKDRILPDFHRDGINNNNNNNNNNNIDNNIII